MRIARELIDPDADKVVRRLARHGFQAYLVGGCVRDLLLNRTPKDFDVATNATPKEIRQLFRNCRIIGRRFRLAHIFFGPKIIETSTFRANPREGDEVDETDEILIRRDNVFGTDTEDARRRDFTINGLFYDLEAERVIDHVGGLADLERRLVRTIGDPDIRFREDPVRMLRAVKFAARLGLEIEHITLAALIRHRGEIAKCPQPRVLEELYRLLRGGAARRSLALLIDTGLAAILSPHLTALFGPPPPLPEGASADVAPPPRPLVTRAVATRPPPAARPILVGDEAAWAAVWEEDGDGAAGVAGHGSGASEAAWAAQNDPALSHDHELEDVHDPDEEADVQAELHGLPTAFEAAEARDEEDDLLLDVGEEEEDELVAEPAGDDDLDDIGLEDIDLDGQELTGPADEAEGRAGFGMDADDPFEVARRDATRDRDDSFDTPRAVAPNPDDPLDAPRGLEEAPEAGASSLDDDLDDAPQEADADLDDADLDDADDAPREAASDDADLDDDDLDDDEDLDDDDLDDFGDGGRDPGDDGSVGGRVALLKGGGGLDQSPEAMAKRRLMAWSMLEQLDLAFRHGTELSNSLLLGALCAPFVFDELLAGGVRPVEANDAVLEVLHPLAQQLQIARRDAERCRQILLAQRRLAPARRRRGKPMSLVRREFFRDALAVHQMVGQVAGRDVSDLSYWSKLDAQGDAAPVSPGAGTSAAAAGPGRAAEELRSGKKRRRRRGGRRRRRSPGQDQGGEWEPVVGR